MIHRLAIVLVVCFYLFSGICLYGDSNILLNPGFESGITDWQVRGNGTIETISSSPHSGILCGHAYDRTANWHGLQQIMLGKMVNGGNYQISGWVKTNSTTSSDIHITFQKNDDSNSGNPEYKWAASGTADSSGWTYISGNYSLDVTGTLSQLILYIEGPDAGIDIIVDDMIVYGPEVTIDTTANCTINSDIRHQVIEGFGAAGGWYEGWLTAHPDREKLYDLFFNDLGLDIYRLRNTYDQGTSGSTYMTKSSQIVAEAKERNPNLKILICSWSPPDYLKSNGQISGGDNATLISEEGNYNYEGFASWWSDSIIDWADLGVNADYISIQNEPDYDASWDSCRFEPSETASVAGYCQAFETVYNQMQTRFGTDMPKMLAPEATGFHGASGNNLDSYIYALINHDHVYGYCHHLYNINAGDNPDSYINAMESLNSKWGDKPIFQTEYEKTTAAWPDALNMSLLLHNALTIEEVSGYFYWSLFWAEPAGLVSFPSYGSTSYTINSDYYGFKHYSAFVHSDWQRIDTTIDSTDVRISAYINPDNTKLSVIIINTNATTAIDLNLSFDNTLITSGNIFRTSQIENCIPSGSFDPTSPLYLPARSVTTLSLLVESGSTPPDQPQDVVATAGDATINLSWNPNIESDLAGYNIYRSDLSGGNYVKQNTSILVLPEYIDNNVTNFNTYFYVITAVDNDSNESIFSEETSATPNDGNISLISGTDFENGLNDWKNISSNDSHDWILNSGSTPSPQTGPDDGANSSTWYIYFETTDASSEGNTAILESPAINGFARELSFNYHMFGQNTGTLNVDVYDNAWNEAVWSLTGQQHSSESEEYSKAIVSLNEYSGLIRIRFRSVATGSWRGDIAIDNITVTGAVIYGDMNNDNIVNISDLPGFAGYWLSENCSLDLNSDCFINLYEFSELAYNWLNNQYQ